MADIKEDLGNHPQHLILAVEAPKSKAQVEEEEKEEEKEEKPEPSSRAKRVASLDIFRGLTVALMILVDDAGGEWPVIAHAPWNGCNLADFVMPFFLFIVGMAIALALKDNCYQQSDFENVKTSLLGPPFTRIVGACVLIVYMATLYGTYVPDWQYTVHNTDSAHFGEVLTVACNVRGKLDPPCNAVGYIDRKVLGINHVYQHPAWKRSKACTKNSPNEGPFRIDAPSWCWAPFEPEGILSSISSILSTIIGVHFGHVLVHMKGHSSRLRHWTIMGLGLLILGIILHFTDAVPLNKQLYTVSYACVTSGAAALVFSAFYVLVDIWNFKYLFLPLEWIGMNAMLVYVMAAEGIFAGFINGWYYDNPHNTLIYWIQKHVFIKVWHSTRIGILLYVIFAEILFWGIVAGLLHRFSIYWKL
ncbi:hypothetical protein DH2020_026814 [Rehmannia glutinosa]|uniref:Heparan-alpha-glucosaminide N-acetyltransferase n=1 Tax=Rehmannia glutinosa TaxID=99300 RepID=A0ABR0VVX5_REHGL